MSDRLTSSTQPNAAAVALLVACPLCYAAAGERCYLVRRLPANRVPSHAMRGRLARWVRSEEVFTLVEAAIQRRPTFDA